MQNNHRECKLMYMADSSPVHRVRLLNAWRAWAKENGLNPSRPSGQLRKVARDEAWSDEWTPKEAVPKQFDIMGHGMLHSLRVQLLAELKNAEIKHQLLTAIDRRVDEIGDGALDEYLIADIDALVSLNKGLKSETIVYRTIADIMAANQKN